MSELIWCDECGDAHEWRVKKRSLTPRRRLVRPATRLLNIVIGRLSALSEALYAWADRPACERYDHYVGQRDARS